MKNKAEIATLLQLKAELELVEARCADAAFMCNDSSVVTLKSTRDLLSPLLVT